MEAEVKARRFGGSFGVIIPRIVVERERISDGDILKVKIKKVSDLNFMWGRGRDIKKSTDKIMKEIDEGEDD